MTRPTTALAQQQRALLDALFTWPRGKATLNIANFLYPAWARGLKSYQSNGHVLAQRTLQAAYPVLGQLIGADSFAALARAFWHAHPPVCGDLAQWGGELAGFVSASEQLADEPYLPDVARVEWALHTCAGAADRAPEPATFQLLMTQDPAALRLVLAPGCAVLRSAWPVVSIIAAHQQARVRATDDGHVTGSFAGAAQGDPQDDGQADGQGLRHRLFHPPVEPTPVLAAASNKLRAGVAETAVVWRAGYQPQVREAVPGEAELLTALLAGFSLDKAVPGDVTSAGGLDFNAWLPMAVQTALLLGAELLQANAAN